MEEVTESSSQCFVRSCHGALSGAPSNWGAEDHKQRVEDDSNREGGSE